MPTGTGELPPNPPHESDPCPCRSGSAFGECCGPLLGGTAHAPTAVQLMRSRYTAYAVGDAAYVLDTWHPSTRPGSLELDPATRWRSLEILSASQGGPFDATGVVEFVARYRDDDGPGRMHERSSFARDGGRWRYVDAIG